MTKTRVSWSLCAIALLATMGTTLQAEATTRSWRYVVPPAQTADSIEPPAPAPMIAPFGEVSIIPEGTTVTVTIEDDVHPDGSFLFSICQRNQPQEGDYFCGAGADDVSTGNICYTGPKTLRRLVPRNPVEITLWWAPSPCPDAPITGTLTVDG